MNPYAQALEAVTDLLTRLRLAHAFVGAVARAAWLGSPVDHASVDVLVLMTPEQKNQLAMMASNRGFRVEREEVERTAELDLVPLHFEHAGEEIRVHLLIASNALYGHMVVAAKQAEVSGRMIPVVRREDLALLLSFAEDQESLSERQRLCASAEFDRDEFNRLVTAIGARNVVVE